MALVRRSRSASNSAMIDCLSKGVLLCVQSGHDCNKTILNEGYVALLFGSPRKNLMSEA